MLVLNKTDMLDTETRATLEARHPRAVFVSATTGAGIEALVARIAEEATRGSITLTVLVPYTRGDLVQLAHERGHILSERHTDSGTQLVVRMPADSAHELTPFACAASHPDSSTE